MGEVELQRSRLILQACWTVFDAATQAAVGKELRKGPRGGGLRGVGGRIRHSDEVNAIVAEWVAARTLAW